MNNNLGTSTRGILINLLIDFNDRQWRMELKIIGEETFEHNYNFLASVKLVVYNKVICNYYL